MTSKYWNALQALVGACLAKNAGALEHAAADIFASLRTGGVWHLFGSGHSSLLAQEAFHRAGGLVPVNPLDIVEMSPLVNPAKNRDAERAEGAAAKIFAAHGAKKGEVIWIVSNSGINPASVDMAVVAKAAGLKVWAVTCVDHSRAAKSRHSSGKRLFELADGVLDTLLPPGDAILEIPGGAQKFRSGAASLAVGAVLLHTVENRVAEMYAGDGLVPPIYLSANLPGGDEHNKKLENQYAARIARLRE